MVHTPCLRSETLSRIAKADVWVKFENLQFTASFKERGALNTLLQLTDEKNANAASSPCRPATTRQGVAYHAGPAGHSRHHRHAVLHAQQQGEAHARPWRARRPSRATRCPEAATEAHRLADAQKLVFVHPYDDPRIIAGQGTIALEMLEGRARDSTPWWRR